MLILYQPGRCFGGAGMGSSDSFKIYREAVEVLENASIPYIVGGGIAIMAYGRTRDTKDIDLYILDKDRNRALQALASAKFEVDYMPDVHWLCKGFKNGITVDFIMENVGGMHTSEETHRCMASGRGSMAYGCT